ncbi:MAG: PrsW family intramembrane metalloprotease [Firmicutes bacterium]|nr:PrsW family intramembrane metalloprotease [Bacillota bacterium]
MRLFLLILASFLPAAAWAWFFRQQDRYEKEPPGLLLRTFVGGMMAVPAAIVLEEPFRAAIDTGSTLTKIVVAFLVVGLGEEALKLLVVYITAYRRAEFSEVADGMIYGITAALGFAAVENLLYTLTFGIEIAPARALVSSLAHGAFTGLGGYHLGRARFAPEGAGWEVFLGLITSAFLHGLYNGLIIAGAVSPVGLVVFMVLLYWGVVRRFGQAAAQSPFRPELENN